MKPLTRAEGMAKRKHQNASLCQCEEEELKVWLRESTRICQCEEALGSLGDLKIMRL